MELVRDDDTGVTIRFEKREFSDLLSIVHVATMEYDGLTGEMADRQEYMHFGETEFESNGYRCSSLYTAGSRA